MNYKYEDKIDNSLGYSRTDLPQISLEDITSILHHCFSKGIKIDIKDKTLKSIKFSQNEINEDKILEKIKSKSKQYKTRLYLLSSDGYAIDGHHDLSHALESEESDFKVVCFVFNEKAKKLIKRLNKMSLTTTKDIKDKIKKAIAELELEKSDIT